MGLHSSYGESSGGGAVAVGAFLLLIVIVGMAASASKNIKECPRKKQKVIKVDKTARAKHKVKKKEIEGRE